MKSIYLENTFSCGTPLESMERIEQGRFCTECNQKVHDFRDYSNADLRQFFTNHGTSVCGIIQRSKLDRELYSEFQDKHSRLLQGILLAGVLLSASTTYAMTSNSSELGAPIHLVTLADGEDVISVRYDTTQIVRYSFKVLDSASQEGLIAVKILLYDAQNELLTGLSTDYNGEGFVDLNHEFLERFAYVRVTSFEYENVVQIAKEDLNQSGINEIQFAAKPYAEFIIGLIAIPEPTKKDKRKAKRQRRKFTTWE